MAVGIWVVEFWSLSKHHEHAPPGKILQSGQTPKLAAGLCPAHASHSRRSRCMRSPGRNSGAYALGNAGISLDLFERFRLLLRTDGWIQNLGKANSHFQAMVTSDPQITQLVRHETLSAILVMLEPKINQWLAPEANVLLASVWGAAGHHRKFDEGTLPQQVSPMTFYAAHSDFAAILSDMSKDLMLSPPPIFDRDLIVARTRREGGDLRHWIHPRATRCIRGTAGGVSLGNSVSNACAP